MAGLRIHFGYSIWNIQHQMMKQKLGHVEYRLWLICSEWFILKTLLQHARHIFTATHSQTYNNLPHHWKWNKILQRRYTPSNDMSSATP